MDNIIEVIVNIPMVGGDKRIIFRGKILLFPRKAAFDKDQVIEVVRVNEQTKLSIFGALLDVPEGKSSEILIIEKGNIISKTYASPLKEGVTLEDRRTWVFEFMDRLMKKLGLQV